MKNSTEHEETRHYVYRLYEAILFNLPEQRAPEGTFTVGGHQCKWATIADMLADPASKTINHDVIALVRYNI
ncbi:hypothetical protein [Bifidobacterium gallicum]|uniref:hypothetical protein n=1 Tax=Bifidobacterium gallicum TaxID=78342 RepID=UPI00018A05A0|nr:hypothetical protein [Bifidobacterium gallicum]